MFKIIMGMGPVKQSVVSKFKIIQNRNYYSTTQSLVYSFISKLSRIFKVEMTGFKHITESGMREPGFTSNHYLIVGLGNYGFDNTRHSVGFKAVDALATRLNIKWGKNGSMGTTKLNHIRLTLFKPKALMNVNGKSVARIANQLSIKPAEVYLIHDELDRVPGKFHLKEGGSAGGHNGVLSCMEALGSKDMVRLRIGIGRPSTKAFVVTYVLSRLPKDELPLVDVAIHQGLDSILDHIKKRSPVSESSLEKTTADTSLHKNDQNIDAQTEDLKKAKADIISSENVRTKKSSLSSDTKCIGGEATPER